MVIKKRKGKKMLKSEFIEKYTLSDATPLDPTAKSIPAEALCYALEEFINDRFRGIARVKTSSLSSEKVLLSAEYTAYFFKMLFTYIYGREFLEINIGCDTKGLNIAIDCEHPLPLTDGERRSLIKIARNAGMQIYPEGNGLYIIIPFSEAAKHRVYASSVKDGRRIMLSKLDEIFFCGAPMMSE